RIFSGAGDLLARRVRDPERGQYVLGAGRAPGDAEGASTGTDNGVNREKEKMKKELRGSSGLPFHFSPFTFHAVSGAATSTSTSPSRNWCWYSLAYSPLRASSSACVPSSTIRP